MRLRLQRVDALSALDVDGKFFAWAIDCSGLRCGAYRIAVAEPDRVPTVQVIEPQAGTAVAAIRRGNSALDCAPGAICVGRLADKPRQTLGHSQAALNALLALLTAARERREPIELEITT